MISEDAIAKTPYPFLFVAIFMFLLAVGVTSSGRAWDRSCGWVDRSKDPKGFWEIVGGYYFFGGVCLLYYLYWVYKP